VEQIQPQLMEDRPGAAQSPMAAIWGARGAHLLASTQDIPVTRAMDSIRQRVPQATKALQAAIQEVQEATPLH